MFLKISKLLLLSFLAFLVIIIFLSSCAIGAGIGDWEVPLPNGYMIARVSAGRVVLADESGSVKISKYLEEFCYNERYVCVKQTSSDEKNPLYYIVDTVDDVVHGSFETEAIYKEKVKELSIENLTEWEKINPIPKSASFPSDK